MPAKDQCKPQVRIQIGNVKKGKVSDAVCADLMLQKDEQQILVVEIKGFPGNRPYPDALQHAVGQYLRKGR